MSHVDTIIQADPIEELKRFLEAHPNQISAEELKCIIKDAREDKLRIRGSIDFKGYECIESEFSMPKELNAIQLKLPINESPYTNFVVRIFHDAGDVLVVAGAGLDSPIVPTGKFLEERPPGDREIAVKEIVKYVLFYGATPLTRRWQLYQEN